MGNTSGDIICTHGGVCGSEAGFLLTGVRKVFVSENNSKQMRAGIKFLQSFQTCIHKMYSTEIRAHMSSMLIHKDDEARIMELDDFSIRWLPCQEAMEPVPQGMQSKFDSLFAGMDHLRVIKY